MDPNIRLQDDSGFVSVYIFDSGCGEMRACVLCSSKQNVLPFIYPQKRYTVWLTTVV